MHHVLKGHMHTARLLSNIAQYQFCQLQITTQWPGIAKVLVYVPHHGEDRKREEVFQEPHATAEPKGFLWAWSVGACIWPGSLVQAWLFACFGVACVVPVSTFRLIAGRLQQSQACGSCGCFGNFSWGVCCVSSL